jgi:hypothetical protein
MALAGAKLQQPRTGVFQASTDVMGGYQLQLPDGELAWVQSLQELPQMVQAAKNAARRVKQRLFWVTLE